MNTVVRAKSNFISEQSTQLVNDRHSLTNSTSVRSVMKARSLSHLVSSVIDAARKHQQIGICGGRHAMGGQQFLESGLLLDMTAMDRVLNFDAENGLIEVEAGIMWTELIAYLQEVQKGRSLQWAIAQKQTGCDRLSLGGALASNIHGRGLNRPPIIDDVEGFQIVMHDGEVLRCDRQTNAELFRLAIGGYGLFGIVASVTLRLVSRTHLQRTVEVLYADDVVKVLESRARAGALYGDFQFAIDDKSPDFLVRGIASTYAPISGTADFSQNKLLSNDDWFELLLLAHTDKTAAYEKYEQHYLSTSGQVYSSDTFQLATYFEGYHEKLNDRLHYACPGTELITELYVPRTKLSEFLHRAAEILREENADVIYGTVRLIERDEESYLKWAGESWACTVFNLHIEQSPQGMAAARQSFTRLIQLAISLSGSYYLTYQKFATREQILECYPQLIDFFALKTKYDPETRFSNNWYEHYRSVV